MSKIHAAIAVRAARIAASPRKQATQRRGAITVLAAFFLVVMLGLAVFAIDIGYITNMRTDAQAAVDASALAGAGAMGLGKDVAHVAARHWAKSNPVTGKPLSDDDLTVELGNWNKEEGAFSEGAKPLNAVRVFATSKNRRLFFGPVLGPRFATASAEAIATYQPRDIMLVLDYSGSMRGSKIRALQNAVSVFIAALQETAADDRVGFSWYNHRGELERALTYDLESIDSAVRSRRAEGWTNIGEGMEKGRIELTNNSRTGALKLMVLMTDGLANRPRHRDPRAYVRQEAQLAAQAGIPIVTISFGYGADWGLMRSVADTTEGVHFHVAGSVAKQEKELRDVFLKVAAQRPLQLVK